MSADVEGNWVAPILAERGVDWTAREQSLLTRALAGTKPEYRADVVLSLINTGYKPTDETFMLVAMFGHIKSVALDIPRDLADAKKEFNKAADSVADSIATLREEFSEFPLTVQRLMESIGDTMRTQADALATDMVSKALASKQEEIRVMVAQTIGAEVRNALKAAIEDNREMFGQVLPAGVRGSLPVARPAGGGGRIPIPIPVKLVHVGGLRMNFRQGLVPAFLLVIVSLFVGEQWGKAHPDQRVSDAAVYGRAVFDQRAHMPANVKAWLDEHVRPR